MKRISAVLMLAGLYLFPVFAFAVANTGDTGAIEDLVAGFGRIVEMGVPIMIGLALIAFFWGLVKYLFAASDDDKKSGKNYMIGGIIAIFIMVSILGIAAWLRNVFGIGNDSTINTPTIQGGGINIP